MFPISDDNPEPGVPIVTWGLIGLCVAAYLWEASLPEAVLEQAILAYGAVPSVLFGYAPPADLLGVPVWATAVSSMFLHGGFLHLAGNMLYLYIFGDNVELAMGRVRFFLFYVICGVLAVLAHGMLAPRSDVPLVGASGAISGVLGAYLLLQPHGRVRVLFTLFPLPVFRVFTISAFWVLGVWFGLQLISALSSPVEGGGVAFWAHVGGFVAGLGLVVVFKRNDVALLAPATASEARAEKQGPWGVAQAEQRPSDDREKSPEKPRRGPWG